MPVRLIEAPCTCQRRFVSEGHVGIEVRRNPGAKSVGSVHHNRAGDRASDVSGQVQVAEAAAANDGEGLLCSMLASAAIHGCRR